MNYVTFSIDIVSQAEEKKERRRSLKKRESCRELRERAVRSESCRLQERESCGRKSQEKELREREHAEAERMGVVHQLLDWRSS
jgi:hypothetical protein